MSKKVIQIFESDNYTIGLIKESMLASIISDTYTFGIMILSFWINYHYIHSRLVSGILLFCFLLNAAWGTKKKLVTKEEFKKIVDEYLGEEA